MSAAIPANSNSPDETLATGLNQLVTGAATADELVDSARRAQQIPPR